MPTHYFTVAEANSLLPQISLVVEEMLDARQHRDRVLGGRPVGLAAPRHAGVVGGGGGDAVAGAYCGAL